MNKHKLFIRILVSPAILLLLAITYAYHLVLHFISYIRWGGEWVTFKKDDRKYIDDIFQMLKTEIDKRMED